MSKKTTKKTTKKTSKKTAKKSKHRTGPSFADKRAFGRAGANPKPSAFDLDRINKELHDLGDALTTAVNHHLEAGHLFVLRITGDIEEPVVHIESPLINVAFKHVHEDSLAKLMSRALDLAKLKRYGDR